MYRINDIPLSNYGLLSGIIGSKLQGYALNGIWSLPKRLGETYRDWQGDLEPYVDADDIRLDGRELSLSLVCKSTGPNELRSKIETFISALPDYFTLSHAVLGSYDVGLKGVTVETYNQWAQLTLKLREPQPSIGTVMPVPANGNYGIDGYSWEQLGFVVSAIDARQNLGDWAPLNMTVSPLKDSWRKGSRQVRSITIIGTIKGDSYDDFAVKVAVLQSLFSAPGVRTIRYYDGSVINCFCVDGFTGGCRKFGQIHWGTFNSKLIVL